MDEAKSLYETDLRVKPEEFQNDEFSLAKLEANLLYFIQRLNESRVRTRERSLIVTKLDEAVMWTARAIVSEPK